MHATNSIYPRCARSAVNRIAFSKYIFAMCVLLCADSLSPVAGFVPYSHPSTHITSGAGVLAKGNIIHSSCTTELHQSSTTGEEFDLRPANKKNTLSTLSENYKQLTTDHYLLMAFLQAGFLASGADMATQMMEGGNPIDFSHVAAMATVASTFSGAINAVWLRQLEQAFPGKANKEVATKTLIHAVILASIINSAYLVGVPLFSTYFSSHHGTLHLLPLNIATVFKGWNFDEFLTLTKLEVAMFIPYNTLAFKFVPPQVRPLTHATISATFNVAVSAITLGYFDSWCERVISTIS